MSAMYQAEFDVKILIEKNTGFITVSNCLFVYFLKFFIVVKVP